MSEPTGRAWSYVNPGRPLETRRQKRERMAAESGRRRMVCIGLLAILLGWLAFVLPVGWLVCVVLVSILGFIQIRAGFEHSAEAGWAIAALLALEAIRALFVLAVM